MGDYAMGDLSQLAERLAAQQGTTVTPASDDAVAVLKSDLRPVRPADAPPAPESAGGGGGTPSAAAAASGSGGQEPVMPASTRCAPAAARVGDPCAVCRDEYAEGDRVAQLPCSHCFHPHCLWPWLEGAATCPVCRAALPAGEPRRVPPAAAAAGGDGDGDAAPAAGPRMVGVPMGVPMDAAGVAALFGGLLGGMGGGGGGGGVVGGGGVLAGGGAPAGGAALGPLTVDDLMARLERELQRQLGRARGVGGESEEEEDAAAAADESGSWLDDEEDGDSYTDDSDDYTTEEEGGR